MSIRHEATLKLFGACLAAASLMSAQTVKGDGIIAQELNENLSPAPLFWCPSQVGWYWTPPEDLYLIGIQTRLRTGFSNINNNFTFTTTLYTDRPAVGGVAIGAFSWNGAADIDEPGVWQGGEFAAPIPLECGVRYFVGMAGWEQGFAFFGNNCGAQGGGSGVNWIDPPDQANGENLGAGSGYLGENYEVQGNPNNPVPANIDSPILRFVVAPRGYVARDLNENLVPAPYFWCPSQIGWYWTPPANLKLIGIQTQLRGGFPNINNNFVFTTTLWTDRPAVGGTAMGSHTWHGARPIDGPWLGGEFDSPISLQGGVPYFVGMTGWEQGFASFGNICSGAGGGSGVNWIDPPNQPGAENLGAGSGYLGANFETQMNNGPTPANIDSPVIRFIAILDADNDDVADEVDQCPNSAAGLAVDDFGRPRLDANLDCLVNASDLPIIIQELLGLLPAPEDCGGNPLRDANGDGVLNGADVQQITQEIIGP